MNSNNSIASLFSTIFLGLLAVTLVPPLLVFERFRWFLVLFVLLFINLIYSIWGNPLLSISAHLSLLVVLVIHRILAVYKA